MADEAQAADVPIRIEHRTDEHGDGAVFIRIGRPPDTDDGEPSVEHPFPAGAAQAAGVPVALGGVIYGDPAQMPRVIAAQLSNAIEAAGLPAAPGAGAGWEAFRYGVIQYNAARSRIVTRQRRDARRVAPGARPTIGGMTPSPAPRPAATRSGASPRP